MPDTIPNLTTELASATSHFGAFILKRPSGKTARVISKAANNFVAVFFLGGQTVDAADFNANDWENLGAIEDVPMSQGGQKADEEEE